MYQHVPRQDPPKFTQIGIWFENMHSGNHTPGNLHTENPTYSQLATKAEIYYLGTCYNHIVTILDIFIEII
jgi:hypothetical protein